MEIEDPVDTGTQNLGHILSQAGPAFSLPLQKDKLPGIFGQRMDFAVNGGTYSGNVIKNADLNLYSSLARLKFMQT